MHDGAGEIISAANDQELLLSVLRGLMVNNGDRYAHYHSLAPAMDAAGDRAFQAVVERATAPGLAEEEIEGLSSFLTHFSPQGVSRELALRIALDEGLPYILRLRACVVAGAPLDSRAFPLIQAVLESEGFAHHWEISKLLSYHPDRAARFRDYLRDERLSATRKRELAGDLTHVLPDESERKVFIQDCLADSTFDVDIVHIIRLFAARFGDRVAFESLVSQIDRNPIDVVGQTISLFGHHPGPELAHRAAELANARISTGAEASQLAGSAVTGMLYVYDMDYGFGGLLHYTYPHAGIERWMEVVEQWAERTDLTPLQHMRILTDASQLGSGRARERVEALVLALDNPDDKAFDAEDDYGHIMSAAIREARRRRPLLPLAVAERFVRAKRPNVPIAGVPAIQAHGNRDALNLLLKLHREIADWHTKDQLANSIELLAAKLGLTVQRDDAALVIAPQHDTATGTEAHI